jgi:hypothetical protein
MDGPIPDCRVPKVIPDQWESAMAVVIPDCDTNKNFPYCCEDMNVTAVGLDERNVDI